MESGFIVGILFGVILQSSQFCFFSGFRSLVLQKNTHFLTALMIAISIQSIGFFSLQEYGLIEIPQGNLPLFSTILGGLIMGGGMTLASCSASGTWFRSGEGKVGIWLVLFSFSITLVSGQTGSLKRWLEPLFVSHFEMDTVYESLHISPWAMVVLLTVTTLFLLVYQNFSSRYTAHSVVKYKLMPLNCAGALLGLLGISAWYFSADSGRNFGFAIAGPTENVLQFIVTDQADYINWGSLFVLGIMLGSIICAILRREFKLTLPLDGKTALKHLTGGIFMGIGATLAGGCTVTNTLVATAYFSWNGWIATISVITGIWLASGIGRSLFIESGAA